MDPPRFRARCTIRGSSRSFVCTNTGLLVLMPPYLYQHRFAGPRAALEAPNLVPPQVWSSWCVQNLRVVLFDLSKPMVLIGVQMKEQYSQAFSFFDFSKPKVFISFQTQKQYSQTLSFFYLPKPTVVLSCQTQKTIHSSFFNRRPPNT